MVATDGYQKLAPPIDLRGMRVLVIDDNSTSRVFLKEALTSFDFDVATVNSGPEAIELLENTSEKRPFNLVLMAWKMPGMDGIETTNKIRNNKNLSNIPSIVMVTAYGREEVMKQAEDIDMDGFLTKPVNQSTLFDTIMSIFGREATYTSPEKREAIAKKNIKQLRGIKILVAEDNDINQLVAKDLLEQTGVILSIANNGHEAVKMVQETRYDLVLMDLQMPIMDGLEACKKIRKIERLQGLPILAVTAHGMSEDRERCLQAGMNDHVTKPINPPLFFSAILKAIGAKEIDDGISAAQTKTAHFIGSVNVELGLSRVSGNSLLYRELLDRFLFNYADGGTELQNLLQKEDNEPARRLVHTIKGVAGNIGAMGLSTVAGELEHIIHKGFKGSGNLPQANLEKFKTIHTEAIDAINDILQSDLLVVPKEEPKNSFIHLPKLETLEIKELAQELNDAIEDDIVLAMELLEDLKRVIKESFILEILEQIESNLKEYDLDMALVNLSQVFEFLDKE